ncbi:enoyl-CoA hydratase [Caldovatus aquaticus]|uniref:Enoyl-CoA hydratase/isomerase family protein n=1 Tax=Caldovatus aquaticus TaxID=2865671 RepID=A0ABS7F0V7_9PROT|nr:enoyl-CoA hydratase [Caldovatus aquaticus]MBW8269252.1 enoyl-CoA hydratase/isomerase family protein [Caldovatus aquaticus]
MAASAGDVTVRLDPMPHVGPVAWVTIANEAKRNALGSPLLHRFAAAVEGLAAHADLRAAVVTGAGERAFVGGADIREMADLAGPAEARRFIEAVHRACRAVRDLPVPAIARINGAALGAGLELAAACDLRIAAATARFGMPEVLLGLPSVVEAALLPTLIGWGRARRLLLLGETIGAEEALAWGLVERVAAPGPALDAAVTEWLERLGRAGPRAVRLQKRLIRAWEELPMAEAIRAGISTFAEAWSGEEPRRMLTAFLERRKTPEG